MQDSGRPATGVEYAAAQRGRLPFWVATPVRLARFPGVLLAVVGAAAILAVATAAGPLFVSSAGTASLAEHLAEARRTPALTVIAFRPVSAASLDPPDRALKEAVSGSPQLGPANVSVLLTVTVSRASDSRAPHGQGPNRPITANLLTRTGFLSHVQVSGSSAAAGVWIPADLADSASIGAGDTLTFASGSSSATATVAGTYRPLTEGPLPVYWSPLREFLVGSGSTHPAPTVLADRQTLSSIGEALRGTGRVEWDVPLVATRMALPEGQALAGRLGAIQQDVRDPHTSLGSTFRTVPSTEALGVGAATPFTSTSFPDLVTKATRITTALEGPVETISQAGRVLALLGVAAAGVYAVRRRRVEASLLSARGVAPLIQGGNAALEALVPAAAGAAAGWFAALGLVRLFGPSSFLQASVERSTMLTTAVVVGFGLLILGAASALATRLQFEEIAGTLPGRLSRAPWEAVVLLLAAAALYEIESGGTAVSSSGGTARIDRLLLLFPLLFIAGVGGLVVRALRVLLARARGSGSRWRTALYLAVRRLASAPRVALLLVTASSLAVGILVYAVMVSASVTSTTRQKALVATGSDVAVPVAADAPDPASLPPGATLVARVGQASVLAGGQAEKAVDLLVIDPATFAQGAFWDGHFSGTALSEILDRLPRTTLRVPAVGVGLDLGDQAVLRLTGTNVPLTSVARATAFPGMREGRPMIVVARSTLVRAAPGSTAVTKGARQVWASGDAAGALAALRRAGIPTSSAVTAQRLIRTPGYLAVSWTFSFLEALGLVAGLVVLVGLVLYLQSRQESREVAYALARRMGLSAGSHRRSVAIELAGMLLGAFVVGAALAAVATRLIYRKLDLLPGQPPAPVYRIPASALGAIALALAVVAVIGAAAVQRRANRANVGEVMRLAA